jgi:hypothetical protein
MAQRSSRSLTRPEGAYAMARVLLARVGTGAVHDVHMALLVDEVPPARRRRDAAETAHVSDPDGLGFLRARAQHEKGCHEDAHAPQRTVQSAAAR